jgi:hypothetical protein
MSPITGVPSTIELVQRRVALVGQFVDRRQDECRDVGPGLVAGGLVKGVQHAVVGGDVNHRWRGSLLLVLKPCVVVVGIVPRRPLHVHRFGTDDVAEQMVALAIVGGGADQRTLVALVAAQEVHQIFPAGRGLCGIRQADRADRAELRQRAGKVARWPFWQSTPCQHR